MLELHLRTIDRLFLFLHNAEKQGAMDMEKFKYLLMDEITDGKNYTNIASEEFIKEILEAAKFIPVGKQVPMNSEAMSPAAFYNKIWALKKAHLIPDDLVPSRKKGRVYLAKVNRKRQLAEN